MRNRIRCVHRVATDAAVMDGGRWGTVTVQNSINYNIAFDKMQSAIYGVRKIGSIQMET